MTAFDRAWALIKMPLVRDSIEYGEPDSTGFPTATATFQHPDDPNVQYDMEAYEDQGGTKMRVYEPPTGMWDRVEAGSGYFQTGHDPNPDDTITSDINTHESHRRLGIATAMYDLINEMSKTKGTRVSSTPSKLSHENAHLWRKALRRSRGFGFKNNSNEQIMWPEEGVYE